MENIYCHNFLLYRWRKTSEYMFFFPARNGSGFPFGNLSLSLSPPGPQPLLPCVNTDKGL